MPRDDLLVRSLDLLTWVASRKRPFSPCELGNALGIGRRSAYRWVAAAEAAGIIELAEPGRPGRHVGYPSRYRALVKIERKAL